MLNKLLMHYKAESFAVHDKADEQVLHHITILLFKGEFTLVFYLRQYVYMCGRNYTTDVFTASAVQSIFH